MENKLKDLFISVVQAKVKSRDTIDEALDPGILNIDFVFIISEPLEHALDTLTEYVFGEETLDWINWWVYEKNDSPNLEAYDEDHNVIPTDSIEDLWNLIYNSHVDKQK